MSELKKIPVILDADTGVDDTMAILLAARHPNLEVLAVTATFGNTTTEFATKNTLNALAMCGREDIPVAAGSPVPWKKKLRTSPYIHGDNGVGEYEYPVNHTAALTGEYAWDLTYRKIMEYPGKVNYIAQGPLTNLATMLRKYPEVKDHLGKVLYMGGELRGDSAGSQCASVNVFHDPDAAQYVLRAGLDFHLCTGGAVTSNVVFGWDELEEHFGDLGEEGRALLHMLGYYFEKCGAFHGEAQKTPIHDTPVIMYLVEPECFTTERIRCEVEVGGPETYGYSLIDLYNLGGWSEEEKNVHFVRVKADKTEYLAHRIMHGIRGEL